MLALQRNALAPTLPQPDRFGKGETGAVVTSSNLASLGLACRFGPGAFIFLNLRGND
jgi:hypothetical protein